MPTQLANPGSAGRDGLNAGVSAVLRQPRLPQGEVGHDALHAGPELRRVMGVLEVHQLVDGDVLDDARREEDGAPVEVEAAAFAAGAQR